MNDTAGKNKTILQTKKDDLELRCAVSQEDLAGSGLLTRFHSLSAESANDHEIEPPKVAPDGGWGWVVGISAFFIMGGVGLSVGTFGIIYIDLVEQFGGKSGHIGWIGSVFSFVGNLCGVPLSILIDIYGCRVVTVVTGLCMALGFVASSFATNPLVLLISYGVLGGIGFGGCLLSSLVIVQQYFDKYRAIAAGFSSAGMPLGKLISGPLIQLLIDTFSWRGALIIEAGIFLHITFLGMLLRPVSQYQKLKSTTITGHAKKNFCQEVRLKLGDASILKDVRFVLTCLSGLLIPMCMTSFNMHVPKHAYLNGTDRKTAALLPTIIGATAFVTRFFFSCLANMKCVNRLVMYGITGLTLSGAVMIYAFITSMPWLAIACAAFGVCTGSFYSILSTILVDLVGIKKYTRAQAFYMICFGLGALIAPPLVGYILDITEDYTGGFIMASTCGLVGSCLSLVASRLPGKESNEEDEDKEEAA